MSVSIKIKLGDNQDDFELNVNENATVADVIAAISNRQDCPNERITLRSEGVPLSRKSTIKGLDFNVALHASLDQPKVVIVAPNIPLQKSSRARQSSLQEPSRERGSISIESKKLDLPVGEVFTSRVDRFPIGRWVETKIKNSLFGDGEDNDQWCMGKVVKDTNPGYVIDIFESYKYFMPPTVQAADDEVRRAKRRSLRLIQHKSDEKSGDEEDSIYNLKTQSSAASTKPSRKGRKDTPHNRRTRSYEVNNRRRRARSRDFNRWSSNDLQKKKVTTPSSKGRRKAMGIPKQTRYRSCTQLPSKEELSRAYYDMVNEYVKKFPDIEPKEVKTYIRLFRKELDINKKGTITKKELSKWIKENKINLEKNTLDEMLKSLDIKEGGVNMENFIDIICSAKVGTKGREVRELFKSFDTDGSGAITVEELRSGLKKLFKQDISDDEIENMVKEADSTGTGEICFKDFKKMMVV